MRCGWRAGPRRCTTAQPWLWVADSGRLDLFLDPSRVLHTDRSTRQAHISCGAVIDHLRVAMTAAGWMANVDRFPNPNNPEPPGHGGVHPPWTVSLMTSAAAPTRS